MKSFRSNQNRLKLLFVVILSLFCCLGLQAQAPQGVNFQAVARDAFGTPMPNTTLTVRFTAKTGAGAPVYQETHSVTTDPYGLFKAVLGRGTVLSGTFSTIAWGASQHQVEVEINDGSGFTSAGNCLFESVPYALYAEQANMAMDDLVDVDLTGLSNGQVMIWNGTDWVPTTLVSSPWSDAGNGITYLGGRVGVGSPGPLEATFELPDTANVLFGDSMSGSGFKLLWYGAKGAFRYGYLSNAFGGYNYDKFWDYDSVGYYSFAGGQNSRAKGFGSFAFGSFGWADGSGSVAFFGNAKGNGSFTFGGSSKGRGSITFEGTAEEEGGIAMYGYAGGRYGVAIGGGTTGLGASSSREDYAVAIGWNSDARGQASVALGPSDAYGYNSFSTGWVTEARGNYSSTFGYRTNSYPYASMALGRYNVINGDSASWVASDPVFMIGDGTSTTNRSNSFVVQKNGQTAIGYDSPTGMLQVSSALGSLNNGGALDATNASLLLGTTTAGLAFDPNQIEAIGTGLHLNFNSPEDVYLVNGGGSVGIGTSTPSDRFHIAANTGENAMRIQIAGITRFRVHSNGGVSVGVNATPPAGGLRIDGSVYPNVNGAYSLGAATLRWSAVYAVNGTIQTSDARYKTDILPLEYGLKEVLQMKPVRYHWIASPQGPAKVGLIAQEVERLVPEVVSRGEDPEGTLGMNYAELVPVLVKAVQEQQTMIAQQQQQLAQQQANLNAMKEELETLKAAVEALKK